MEIKICFLTEDKYCWCIPTRCLLHSKISRICKLERNGIMRVLAKLQKLANWKFHVSSGCNKRSVLVLIIRRIRINHVDNAMTSGYFGVRVGLLFSVDEDTWFNINIIKPPMWNESLTASVNSFISYQASESSICISIKFLNNLTINFSR